MIVVRVRARRGFTLFEVLLALGLTALLVGAVFSFMETLGKRREELGRETAGARVVGVLIDRIESDLAASIVSDGRAGAGIKGGGAELSVLTRRVVGSADGTSTEISRATYSFDATGGVVRVRRAGVSAQDGVGSGADSVAEGVRRLRFRYFDGRAWRAEFDSEKEDGFPAAVEVAVWAGARAGPTASGTTGDAGAPRGEPDRVRTIVIPDGPTAAWKEGR